MDDPRESIDVSSAAFRHRLAARMRERGMSAALLARRARMDEAVVRAVMLGTRARIERDALERLASALQTDPRWLAAGDAAPGARPDAPSAPSPPASAGERQVRMLRGAMIASLVAMLAAGVWLVRDAMRTTPRLSCSCDRPGVEARNERSGKRLWHVDTRADVSFCAAGPWTDRPVALYATRPFKARAGELVVRDLARGDSLWAYTPDAARMVDLYPPEIAGSGSFSATSSQEPYPSCSSLAFGDYDGDGDPDLAIHWVWLPWYPSLIEWHVRDRERPGHFRRRGAYYTSGRTLMLRPTDVDGDGRPELLAAGTNNAAAYQGAMVILLDADHWGGASADSLALAPYWRAQGDAADSCRVRVVFPQMSDRVMAFLGAQRLDIRSLEVRAGSGSTEIDIVVGGEVHPRVVEITMDSALRPLGVRRTPEMQDLLEKAPDDVRAAFTDDALAAWLAKHRRFGAGPGGPGSAR